MRQQNLVELHPDELPGADRVLLAGYGVAGPDAFPVTVNAGVSMVGVQGDLLLWIGGEGVYDEDAATLEELGFSPQLSAVLRAAHARVGDLTYLLVTDNAPSP